MNRIWLSVATTVLLSYGGASEAQSGKIVVACKGQCISPNKTQECAANYLIDLIHHTLDGNATTQWQATDDLIRFVTANNENFKLNRYTGQVLTGSLSGVVFSGTCELKKAQRKF
jgi:hypothetical protein